MDNLVKDLKVNDHEIKDLNGFIYPKKHIKVTQSVKDPEEAVNWKLNQIEPKIFGKRIISYNIENTHNVYVPYHYFAFDFNINRKVGLNRQGQIIYIYDLNEEFPFYFDPREDELNIKKINHEDSDYDFLTVKGTMDDALRKCNTMLQKRMFRFYRTTPHAKLTESWLFYRPAVELQLNYKGMVVMRYAYLDGYNTSSETLNGMKLRIES